MPWFTHFSPFASGFFAAVKKMVGSIPRFKFSQIYAANKFRIFCNIRYCDCKKFLISEIGCFAKLLLGPLQDRKNILAGGRG